MKKIEKKDIWLFAAQVAVWALVLFAMPLATFLSTQDVKRYTNIVLCGVGTVPGAIGRLLRQLLSVRALPLLQASLLAVYAYQPRAHPRAELAVLHGLLLQEQYPQHARDGCQHVDRFLLGLPDVPGAELAWLKRMGYHMTKM